jgi:hypothetical protein
VLAGCVHERATAFASHSVRRNRFAIGTLAAALLVGVLLPRSPRRPRTHAPWRLTARARSTSGRWATQGTVRASDLLEVRWSLPRTNCLLPSGGQHRQAEPTVSISALRGTGSLHFDLNPPVSTCAASSPL